MGALDALIYGLRNAFSKGTKLPLRSDVNFTGGLKGVDNPLTEALDVSLDTSVPVPLGSGYSLGSQTPPQFSVGVSNTVLLSSGTQIVGTVPVPPGKVVTFDLAINASIILPTPGILLPGALDLFCMCSAYGTSGAKVLGSPATDTGRSSSSSPWIPTSVNLNPSGNTVQIIAQAYTVPAFSSGHAYTGALAGGTTVPNAIGDTSNSLVTNDSGKIYVCVKGGTDSSSGGPTGTGPGKISVGGLDYYYVGPAANGVPLNVTVTLNGIKTG